MTDAQRRADLIAAYPGQRWKRKVNKMSEAQVLAIWSKIQAKNEQEKGTNQ